MTDNLVEYALGDKFPGTIGKTIDDSKEAWPVPKRAAKGTPNVLFYVLDDAEKTMRSEATTRHDLSKQ